jgi:pyruvate dehydrogenase E2 component (dihydrolipoyllysine-residue acetyltransferase)
MGTLADVKVPPIGDFTDVKVIEIMVKPGDKIAIDDPLVTIESDKASMEVPSPQSGVVKELKINIGDAVSEGTPILLLDTEPAPSDVSLGAGLARSESSSEVSAASPQSPEVESAPVVVEAGPPPRARPLLASVPAAAPLSSAEPGTESTVKPHASPSVRQFARVLGVDLTRVTGSGLKGRIFRSDLERFVNTLITGRAAKPAEAAPLNLIPWPKVDFSRFGPTETKPLSRIKKISKSNLARNWVLIPHVTQFDEVDATELEGFRHEINQDNSKVGTRVTLLSLILKGLVAALTRFPEFNASLEGDNLILKRYFHLGFAVDTPDGLVVPVVRDVDKKGILTIANEMSKLSEAARAVKLKPADMQGGCFTVSSLGGIGGTCFTPIINAPEVAILGVSRLTRKPVYRDDALVPRLMLPLSLSYDHRVIDGADAARFITFLGSVLADLRRALL